MIADHQVGELALETGGFDDVVIDPMVIAAPGLVHDHIVVFEPVFMQPFLSDLPVFFGPGSEKGDDVAFVIPFIDDLQCIGIGQDRQHAFGLFIGDVIAYRPVYVDHKILDPFGQERADFLPFFIVGIL